jgi:hypothetical protein
VTIDSDSLTMARRVWQCHGPAIVSQVTLTGEGH